MNFRFQVFAGNFSSAISVCSSEGEKLFAWFNFSEFQVF
jgi:hypothetical protein